MLAVVLSRTSRWSRSPSACVGLAVVTSRDEGELGEWFAATWGFAKQILPLLLGGVLVAGLLLGRPGHEGLIPIAWVAGAVGGNSLGANLFASVAGAFMYFATLTEVPILQGLIGSRHGQGAGAGAAARRPGAVAAEHAGARAASWARRRPSVYVALVVVMATITGTDLRLRSSR